MHIFPLACKKIIQSNDSTIRGRTSRVSSRRYVHKSRHEWYMRAGRHARQQQRLHGPGSGSSFSSSFGSRDEKNKPNIASVYKWASGSRAGPFVWASRPSPSVAMATARGRHAAIMPQTPPPHLTNCEIARLWKFQRTMDFNGAVFICSPALGVRPVFTRSANPPTPGALL